MSRKKLTDPVAVLPMTPQEIHAAKLLIKSRLVGKTGKKLKKAQAAAKLQLKMLAMSSTTSTASNTVSPTIRRVAAAKRAQRQPTPASPPGVYFTITHLS